jgi:Autoinducer binding domain
MVRGWRLHLWRIISKGIPMTDLVATATSAPFRSFEEATQFLEETVLRAGVRHLSYWYLQYVDGAPDHVVWVSTYDPSYMSLYMKKFTPMGDAVINVVIDDQVVIDWVEWLDVSEDIYQEAVNYGITKFGISLPIDSGTADKVVFSVNVDADEANWSETRGILAKRFRPFAKDFHHRMAHLVESHELGAAIYMI